jgi:thymidylate synthase (FAD)
LDSQAEYLKGPDRCIVKTDAMLEHWTEAMEFAEMQYFELLALGATPQEARAVLPNSLKTEIVMTANLREWRHIFKLRTSKRAHPDMRRVMIMAYEQLSKRLPEVFADIVVEP